MRFLGHNGEINTIQGNLNRMQSCENSLKSPIWHGRENEIRPFGNPKASDSANLDSAAEVRVIFLVVHHRWLTFMSTTRVRWRLGMDQHCFYSGAVPKDY
ncbi:ferredoxin-dependent glutamate synthase-like isoform X3 [Syzygium oleosum]|uniref:ferredoxin-dependent glutamate synthase-like isoform X3 n=1 Tax=Syzygium oleosum TaxID=219896 RepID=UPI0024BA4820|nr:ferredoxin-dependent glutamate synthase-like isoform X3 [Syzygium oleosum]